MTLFTLFVVALLFAAFFVALGFNGFAGQADANKTKTAGTLIQYLVPPDPRGRARVAKLVYLDAGTAHTLTLLRPIGRTKCSATGAAGQAVINLVADPGVTTGFVNPINGVAIVNTNGIAANDLLAIRETDGITRLYKVSSVATLAITLTANLTTGVDKNSDVWDFGVTTDTDPRTGSAHPAYLGGAGTANTTFNDSDAGVIATVGADEPILLNSNNATAAGTVVQLTWVYTIN